jgi:hypothetical protein
MLTSKLFAIAVVGALGIGAAGLTSLKADNTRPLPEGDLPVVIDDVDEGQGVEGTAEDGYGKVKTKPVYQQQAPVTQQQKPVAKTRAVQQQKPTGPYVIYSPKTDKQQIIYVDKTGKPVLKTDVVVKPYKPTWSEDTTGKPLPTQQQTPVKTKTNTKPVYQQSGADY